MLNSEEMIAIAVKALDDKKGKDIKVLHTADQTTLADYFIICDGSSNTQVRALAEAVEEAIISALYHARTLTGFQGRTSVGLRDFLGLA